MKTREEIQQEWIDRNQTALSSELTELLDAYEERDQLRAALNEQGFLQKKADGSMIWHVHDCPASFDFAQCNYRCRVARAALEGRE